jgi:hypothetical protein
LFDHLIPESIVLDPIEEIEMTREIKFNRDNLQTKKEFNESIKNSLDSFEPFSFDSIVKKNLKNLIQFIMEFHNAHNQSTDFLQQTIVLIMKSHFDKTCVILNYKKWNNIFSNIVSFSGMNHISFSRNEFNYIFHITHELF